MTYKVEVNSYFKGHVEHVRIDMDVSWRTISRQLSDAVN